jgi:GNAT superfamily N-acetyltransferase
MRAEPSSEPGVVHERSGGIVRARAMDNWILWWQFEADAAAAAVRAEADFFRAHGLPLEWKLYGHDEPAGLTTLLAQHGFEADETETLMVLDLHAFGATFDDTVPPGFVVRRVEDDQQLSDFAAVMSEAFGYDATARNDELRLRLFADEPSGVAFVAYADDIAVGAGRLECPPGRSFASIWGGSTIPAFRKRGVFRALVAIRAAYAWRAGYTYLTVDARETSRPILERLGFTPLTTVTGWNLSLDAPA